jgi:hypothetical protein
MKKYISISRVTSGIGLAFIELLQEEECSICPIIRNKNIFIKGNIIECNLKKQGV